ncbi:related to acid sphingomyelinase [Pseudozyma flocculosa]|uniref:Related to acid sphingomyelinase n=2 Tax=Pseudozyma flocculosa TaxID=84751 RepID=A0A5C3FBS2_9BASI|nr:related to acid sphingomyelinase [Pseudozyma flocculosa]
MKVCLLAVVLACTAGFAYAFPARDQRLFEARAPGPASPSTDHGASAPKAAYNTAAYTAPSAFPTSAFKDYYFLAADHTAEPRPVVTDVARHANFPDSLLNPTLVPPAPAATDAVYPVPVGRPQGKKGDATDYAAAIERNISAILDGTQPSCDKCLASLKVAQQLARTYPKAAPAVMIDLCKRYKYASNASCEAQYTGPVLGAVYTQVLSYADFDSPSSTDAQYICANLLGAKSSCPLPAPRVLDDEFLDAWYGGKDRRAPPPPPPKKVRAGKPLKDGGNLKVLHMSDIHVDPRFFVGGEAACTNGRCCRADAYNSTLVPSAGFAPGTLPRANISEVADYWGNYRCDTPWSLVVAALESVTHLNGGDEVDMTIHTGDMVVHDVAQYISKDLVRYTQQSVFDLMKMFLGHGPVFNAIGNHDTAPSDAASQHALPNARGEQFSWDWDNVARLWEAEGWFNHREAEQVRTHYAGYSVMPRKGLRIITINTDFWYKGNVFNNIHTRDPDYSGTLRFLTDELFHAEERGERVWIVGHVLTGWDGSNPLDNPTNLFYNIVERFASTVVHIFFGHTHEDQFNLFYAGDGAAQTLDAVRAVSFMAPSVTPGNNVNPALRIMEVDPETYEVMDWHQFYTEVPTFPSLETEQHGPVFQHLYSAREAYGDFTAQPDGLVWPENAPLNATFWHRLTVEMEHRPELVQRFTVNQGRNSPKSPKCEDEACISAKICYMRSGSAAIGKKCPRGFGSVQS